MKTLTITILLIAVTTCALAAEYVVTVPEEHDTLIRNAFAIKWPIPRQLSDPSDPLSPLVPKHTKQEWVEIYMLAFASDVVINVKKAEAVRAKREAQEAAAAAAEEARIAEEAKAAAEAAATADAPDTDTESDTGTP